MQTKWTEEVPVGITLCDAEGIILSMNDCAAIQTKLSEYKGW